MKELYAFLQKLTTLPEVGLFNVAKNFIGLGRLHDFQPVLEYEKYKFIASSDLSDGSVLYGFHGDPNDIGIGQVQARFQGGVLTHLLHTQKDIDGPTMANHAKAYGYVETDDLLNENSSCKFLYNAPLNITCVISEEKAEDGEAQLIVAFGEGRVIVSAEVSISVTTLS